MFGTALHLAWSDDFLPLRQCAVDRTIGLTLDEAPVARHCRNVAFLEGNPPSRQRYDWQALEFEAFKHIVINGRMLRLGRNLLGGFRVPDDKIGIRTRQHRALL